MSRHRTLETDGHPLSADMSERRRRENPENFLTRRGAPCINGLVTTPISISAAPNNEFKVQPCTSATSHSLLPPDDSHVNGEFTSSSSLVLGCSSPGLMALPLSSFLRSLSRAPHTRDNVFLFSFFFIPARGPPWTPAIKHGVKDDVAPEGATRKPSEPHLSPETRGKRMNQFWTIERFFGRGRFLPWTICFF